MTDIDRRAVLAEADLLIDLGRCEEALFVLGPVLDADPGDVQALGLAAVAHLQEGGDAVEALTLAGRACERDPLAEQPRRLMPLAPLRLTQPVLARQTAGEAVELASDSWAAQFVLGTAHLGDSRARRIALDAARRAVELAPRRWETHQLLARVYLDGGIEPGAADVDAGIGALEAALRLHPASAELRHELARAHLMRGRPTRAIAGFSGAARLDPAQAESVGAVITVLTLLLRYGAGVLTVLFVLGWFLVPGQLTAQASSVGVIRGGRGAADWAALASIVAVVGGLLVPVQVARAVWPNRRRTVSAWWRSEPLVVVMGLTLVPAWSAIAIAPFLPAPGGRVALLVAGVALLLSWSVLGLGALARRFRGSAGRRRAAA